MSAEGKAPWGRYQLLTSAGPAAIAVVRVRGPLAERIIREHISGQAQDDPGTWAAGRVCRATLVDDAGAEIDDILVSVHAPTPNWDVRLHLHGSPSVVRCCVGLLNRHGLREQSEAVSTLWGAGTTIEGEVHALLPRLPTLDGACWLIRQGGLLAEALRAIAEMSDGESARQRCREIISRRGIIERFAQPLRVALVGPPNAGKSTLANALAGEHVSLVSPAPGTTRDWLEIPGEIRGFPVLWLDTAGLCGVSDGVEAEGVRRTRRLMESADATLLVLDSTRSATAPREKFIRDHGDLRPTCIALNKSDLVESGRDLRSGLPPAWRTRAEPVSATEKTGLDRMTARLLEGVGYDSTVLERPTAFTDRQVDALRRAIAGQLDDFRECVRACL